jgi:hypothetical protein
VPNQFSNLRASAYEFPPHSLDDQTPFEFADRRDDDYHDATERRVGIRIFTGADESDIQTGESLPSRKCSTERAPAGVVQCVLVWAFDRIRCDSDLSSKSTTNSSIRSTHRFSLEAKVAFLKMLAQK